MSHLTTGAYSRVERAHPTYVAPYSYVHGAVWQRLEHAKRATVVAEFGVWPAKPGRATTRDADKGRLIQTWPQVHVPGGCDLVPRIGAQPPRVDPQRIDKAIRCPFHSEGWR